MEHCRRLERWTGLGPAVMEASGNSFPIDTIKHVNRVRRLLLYRSMQHRERYVEHEKNEAASEAMREHLLHTLEALLRISETLEP